MFSIYLQSSRPEFELACVAGLLQSLKPEGLFRSTSSFVEMPWRWIWPCCLWLVQTILFGKFVTYFAIWNSSVLSLLFSPSVISLSMSDSVRNTAHGSDGRVYSKIIAIRRDRKWTNRGFIGNIPLTDLLRNEVPSSSGNASFSTTLKLTYTCRSSRWTRGMTLLNTGTALSGVNLRDIHFAYGSDKFTPFEGDKGWIEQIQSWSPIKNHECRL